MILFRSSTVPDRIACGRRVMAGLGLLLAAGVLQADTAAPTPFKKAGEVPLAFRGAGRELPEPEVEDVALGWFGPSDADHPDFGDLWRGVVLGVEAVNADGGLRGKPFRLVTGWSDSPWTAGGVEVAKMAYENGTWAVIGGVDGGTTHLAEQVALKARFALLSPGSTDGTANLANLPWMFSLLPSDERQAPVLAEAARRVSSSGALALVVATDHDSRATLSVFRRALSARRVVPAVLIEFDARGGDTGEAVSRLLEAHPGAVLVVAPSRVAGRLVGELRRRGFAGSILGGATLARNAFRRAAGEAAEGVVAPRLWEASPAWDAFARLCQNRWREAPDDVTAQSYDAVRLLASAVQHAGLNRVRIAEALRAMSPWVGAAGVVHWDALGRNQRPVGLGEWKQGRFVSVRDQAIP